MLHGRTDDHVMLIKHKYYITTGTSWYIYSHVYRRQALALSPRPPTMSTQDGKLWLSHLDLPLCLHRTASFGSLTSTSHYVYTGWQALALSPRPPTMSTQDGKLWLSHLDLPLCLHRTASFGSLTSTSHYVYTGRQALALSPRPPTMSTQDGKLWLSHLDLPLCLHRMASFGSLTSRRGRLAGKWRKEKR